MPEIAVKFFQKMLDFYSRNVIIVISIKTKRKKKTMTKKKVGIFWYSPVHHSRDLWTLCNSIEEATELLLDMEPSEAVDYPHKLIDLELKSIDKNAKLNPDAFYICVDAQNEHTLFSTIERAGLCSYYETSCPNKAVQLYEIVQFLNERTCYVRAEIKYSVQVLDDEKPLELN